MSKKAAKMDEVPLSEIPEVQAYESIMAEYRHWQEANAQYFTYLRQFEERINTAREAADKAVRARGVSCGSWVKVNEFDKVNADAAYQVHGHEKFLTLGGSLETITKKKMDKTRYMSNVAAGVVTPEEKAAVVTRTRAYSTPDPMSVLE